MRKSTRSKNQNKNSNSKSKKNSKEISEPEANIEEDRTETKPEALNNDIVQTESITNEETPSKSKNENSHIPIRSDSKTIFKAKSNINFEQSVRFSFGTGKIFTSKNDPKKGFTESVFNIKPNLQNKFITDKSLKQDVESNDEAENPSTLLEIKGETGEENEERLFDAPAILYRLQLQNNSDNENNSNNETLAKPNEFSFPIPNSLQPFSISRSKSPFTPPNLSRTTSSNAVTKPNTNDTTNKGNNRFDLKTRSNSTPSSRIVEVGTGNIHLNKGNGFYRLVMRRAQIGKVCLNMRVFRDMKPKANSPTHIKFIGYYNSSTNQQENNNSTPELKYEIYILRFKDEATQKEFLTKLDEAINDIEK